MKTLDNSAQIFNALSDVPGDVQDVDELIEVCTLGELLFHQTSQPCFFLT